MDILDEHFPGYTHVFGYDNATAHQKCRPNALSASSMTVNPSPLHKPNLLFPESDAPNAPLVQMDDGIFYDDTKQTFYFPENHPTYPGRFKGTRQIVTERFEYGTPGVPNPASHNGKKMVGSCLKKCADGVKNCCLHSVLYHQPDFVAQKSALEELCEARGYKVIFFPKFHCEVNSIEMR